MLYYGSLLVCNAAQSVSGGQFIAHREEDDSNKATVNLDAAGSGRVEEEKRKSRCCLYHHDNLKTWGFIFGYVLSSHSNYVLYTQSSFHILSFLLF